jgi:hypothetical protein
MTLPSVDINVAAGAAAAIGDIRRFSNPQKLVSYLGLNPSVRQSGEGPAYHGRITKQGRGQARGMLIEAAWAAARSPGPLRAFYRRLAARRGKHIAAVATARKLVMVIWHTLSKDADYIWVRPALLTRKFRSVELRAGLPPDHARHGAAYDYNIPARRAEERSKVGEGGSYLRRLHFPMAKEAEASKACGKDRLVSREGYSTTSVSVGRIAATKLRSYCCYSALQGLKFAFPSLRANWQLLNENQTSNIGFLYK